MTTEEKEIPQRSESINEKDLGDETVVMLKTGDEIHSFIGTAHFIWKLIDGKNSFQDILERIIEEYQVEANVAERDLTSFLNELERLQLLK